MTAALAALILAVPAQAGCHKTFTVPMATRAIHSTYAGVKPVDRASRRRLDYYERCLKVPAARRYVHGVRHRAWVAWEARRWAAAHPTGYDSSDLADVPGVPRDFAACVAFRESDNGTMGDTVYGIIPASGFSVEGAPLSVQKHAFHDLYARDGTAPWAPYDGC